jgi:hypothetical protein
MQWRKIDPNKIVLTDKEIVQAAVDYLKQHSGTMESLSEKDQRKYICTAQSLKVIQEFIDSGIYRHKEWRGLSMHGDWECSPDCPVCELQMKITEGFPNLRNSIKKGTNA